MGACLGLSQGHGRVPLQRGVVVDSPRLVEHPAVTMVGELVEAQVRHEHQLVTACRTHSAQREVEDAFGVVRSVAVRVALLGHPEDHETAEPGVSGLAGGSDERVQGVLDHAGHRRDRDRFARPLTDEDRQHEIGRVQPRLGHQPA